MDGGTVLIVDDDTDVRLAVRLTLEWAVPPFQVVGEAGSGEEAVARWRELRPDVVVLDAHLPGMSGLDAARAILAEHPAQAIVLCTGSADDDLAKAATQLGVRATVVKTAMSTLPAIIRE